MSTIREVAKRAGVAPITVSRVLNVPAIFGRDQRNAESAAAELHYVPNQLARSLRFNRTNILALILSDVTNPFGQTLPHAEDAASEHGYTVMLCNTDENDEKQEQYLSVLLSKRVDGILLVPARSTPEAVQRIQKQRVQVVVLDRTVPDVEVDIVRCASADGSYQLTHHLLELGHRRIAILSGPDSVSVSHERLAGYKRAFHEANLPIDESLIIYGEFTVERGIHMAQQAMLLNPAPTALIGMNNFISIGAQSPQNMNLRCPQDILVASFDDLPNSMMVEPFFTVVAQPAYEIGRTATQLLLNRIANPHDTPVQSILLPTEFIIRQSTQPLINKP